MIVKRLHYRFVVNHFASLTVNIDIIIKILDIIDNFAHKRICNGQSLFLTNS